jgi:rhodanese-related sulfurtransferase
MRVNRLGIAPGYARARARESARYGTGMTTRAVLLAASLLLALTGMACGEEAAPPASAAPVQPAELAALLAADAAPLLLDVRTPEEFAEGHIAGALLVPIAELEARLGELAAYRERGVITYCEVGGRAGRASELLRGAGFANVRLLDGSMRRWRDEGRPVAR